MGSENQKLKKKFWKVFSEYSRRKNADWQGYATCCSCGVTKKWQELDAGHYHPRTDGLSTFFEDKNVHAQCRGCNSFRHGNLARYAIFLIGKYGQGILEELEWKSRQTISISNEEYKRLIFEYKNKIKELDETEK